MTVEGNGADKGNDSGVMESSGAMTAESRAADLDTSSDSMVDGLSTAVAPRVRQWRCTFSK